MFLPEAFIKQTQEQLGEKAEDLFSALQAPASVSVRLNTQKVCETTKDGMSLPMAKKVPWSSFGHYLSERPAFTFDPMMHAGCYYVQEASSMFVEHAIRAALETMGATSVRMLDLCAAPGGKSTLASSVLPEGSLLVANELIRTRANILAENLIKWGNPDVIVTQSDPSAFSGLTHFFDVILTDVPCSGEGMFRKDPGAIAEWSEDNVRLCASRQRDILNHCWSALRPGGFLIYSTCTFNRQEDEDNVRWACEELGANLLDIPVQDVWGISGSLGFTSDPLKRNDFPVYHFMPHQTQGEGFFLALLQKEDGPYTPERISKIKAGNNQKKQQAAPDSVRNMLKNPDAWDFSYNRQGSICALRKEHKSALQQLEEKLRIVHSGIVLGEMKGKDLIPDISLALSTELDRSTVRSCSLDLKQSIAYLRREALVLPEECPLGWVLMLYEGHPLGWMKNIGNRANNAYPNEWRIRSENPY